MKRSSTLILRCLFLVFPTFVTTLVAQEPKWKVEFERDIKWYLPTSTGVMLVSTSEGIHGLDPESQQVIWTLPEFGSSPMENVRAVANTPFYEIFGLPLIKKEKEEVEKKGLKGAFKEFKENTARTLREGAQIARACVFDPLSGEILFDTKDVAIDYINNKYYLKEINCFLFEGVNDKTRMFGLADVRNGKVRWVMEKPVQLPGFTAEDKLAVQVDPHGHLIAKYVDTLYRIQSHTGDYLWKLPAVEAPYYRFHTDKELIFTIKDGSFKKFDLASGTLLAEYAPTSDDFQSYDNFVTPVEIFKYWNYMFAVGDHMLVSGHGAFTFMDIETMQPVISYSKYYKGYIVTNVSPQQPDGNYLITLKNRETKALAISVANAKGVPQWKNAYDLKGIGMRFLEYTPKGVVVVTD